MKKVYFALIVLVMVMMAASCTGTPKSQKTEDFFPETSDSEVFLPPEQAPMSEEIPAETDNSIIADALDEDDIDTEETVVIEDTPADKEPVLAEEELPVQAVEPEPPVLVVVTEPPVAPRAAELPPPQTVSPPPVRPVPRQESPRVTASPPATAAPPPPIVPPAGEEKPPAAEEPPAIVREPPRSMPELSNPTPGISGRQDVLPPGAMPMAFSRVVRATVGQLIEVPFRGTGWVYLGEAGAQRGISYDSRRLDPEGQSFIFRTERAGEYALKFYRQDFIRDFIINDYVQVLVGAPSETAGAGWFSPPVDRSRVIAEPRWPSPLTEAQAIREDGRPSRPDTPSAGAAEPPAGSSATPSAAPSAGPPVQSPGPIAGNNTGSAVTAIPPSARPPVTPRVPSASPPEAIPDTLQNTEPELPVYLDPAAYLEKAKEEFAAGRVAPAITFLDRFCEYYPAGSDETWWLYGQFYEANSPSRNILAALDCYRRLVQEYPQSSRYDDARKRIAYLQRYYININ